MTPILCEPKRWGLKLDSAEETKTPFQRKAEVKGRLEASFEKALMFFLCYLKVHPPADLCPQSFQQINGHQYNINHESAGSHDR